MEKEGCKKRCRKREETKQTKSTGAQKQHLNVQMWGCAKQRPRAEVQKVKAKAEAEHSRGDEEVPRCGKERRDVKGAKGKCEK